MSGKYIGLMSGTSLDSLDAVLVEIHPNGIQLLTSHSLPLAEPLRQAIQGLCHSGNHEIEQLAITDLEIARLSAQVVNELLARVQEDPSKIAAIGSHGQTIRHRPGQGYTLQIGDPSLIAELTGITVVADFRRRDLAAGGQGAPLVPAFHQWLFASQKQHRVVVNIGGISNISILPSAQSEPVTGFDTGPGNLLMDYWCRRHKGTAFDQDGHWAASAEPHAGLLHSLLAEPFFQQPPPKSTGRELFNPQWLQAQLQAFPLVSADEVQATLCQLTARGIAEAIMAYAPGSEAVFVCGGGAHNTTLMNRLQAELPEKTVATTAVLGLEPGWVEATAFAWLACQTLARRPGNLPDVTGAKGLRVLGGIYPA